MFTVNKSMRSVTIYLTHCLRNLELSVEEESVFVQYTTHIVIRKEHYAGQHASTRHTVFHTHTHTQGVLLWLCDKSALVNLENNKPITQSSLLPNIHEEVSLNHVRQYFTKDTWMVIVQKGINIQLLPHLYTERLKM